MFAFRREAGVELAQAESAYLPGEWLEIPGNKKMSTSLIGRSGSSTFRPSTTAVFDVARGLALLFGIGTKALPPWDSRTRRNNLLRPFRQADDRSKRTSIGTSRLFNGKTDRSLLAYRVVLLRHDSLAFELKGTLGPAIAGSNGCRMTLAEMAQFLPIRSYFSADEIVENVVLRWVPIPEITGMIASAIPVAIRPYSIAVASLSSFKNLITILICEAFLGLHPRLLELKSLLVA
jgi:hypothetical protein